MAKKDKERCIIPAAVAALTFLAFLPALKNGFVNWDDEANLLDNIAFRGLGWTQLSWMFSTFHGGHYQPLSWITLGSDYLLWGMHPFGYHLTSLLLHCANAVLAYLLALKLLRLAWPQQPGSERALRLCSGLSALVFSVHPLRVESVAWVTERRDVLSGMLFLLSLICYLSAQESAFGESRRRNWSIAALSLYACSLLSKAIGVGMLLVLLALDFYPLRRLQDDTGQWSWPAFWRAVREKAPFFILAAAAAITALAAQSHSEALVSLGRYGIGRRLLQAVYGVGFYLGKTIVPSRLSPLYSLTPQLRHSWRPYLVSGSVVAALSVVAVLTSRRRPALLTAWLSYLVLLAPVSGLAQAGDQFVADRYSYLSCLGWAVLAGGGLMLCWRARRDGRLGALSLSLASLAAVLSVAGLGRAAWEAVQGLA